MPVTNIFSLVVSVLVLLLGFFVFINRPKNIINQSFGILCLGIAEWVLANFFVDRAKTMGGALLWSQLTLLGPAFIPGAFLEFCFNFGRDLPRLVFWKRLLIYLPALPVLVLFFTKYNISSVELVQGGVPKASVGQLYYFFGLILLISLVWGIIKLIQLTVETQDKRLKLQTIYILLSFLITGIAGIINVFFQTAGTVKFVSFVPLTSIIIVISLWYAIARYQFLDIRLIATESLVVILVIAILMDLLTSNNPETLILKGFVLFLVLTGGIQLIRSVHKEIDQRKKMESLASELHKANQKLREIDAMKTEFVNMASHELLTPISAIEGYLSMILDEKIVKIDDPKAVLYMDRVYQSSKRLAKLVGELLNVARIEEGRLLVQKSVVDLPALIKSVLDELKFKVETAKLTIGQSVAFQGQVPQAFIDPDKIKEVLVNLCGNSIKFTPAGGKIIVSAELWPTEKLNQRYAEILKNNPEVGVEEESETPSKVEGSLTSIANEKHRQLVGTQQLIVSVKDNGIGIAKEELGKLFQKFSRLSNPAQIAPGTGLGLYISRALVELNHGLVWAESEGNGKGSTFYFSLPLASSKAEIETLDSQAPQAKDAKPLAHMGEDAKGAFSQSASNPTFPANNPPPPTNATNSDKERT